MPIAAPVLVSLALASPLPAEVPSVPVGAASIDITPEFPVRLAGFGFRRAESEGVERPIRAQALAIGADPVLLLTADLCVVPDALTEEVARRMGLPRERFVLSVTHSHTAPMVTGGLPTLFGVPVPPEHADRIDRYTRFVVDRFESVAKAALADRRPATLAWNVGLASFAINRRTADGPVDHDLPVLAARDAESGALRAVYVAYACHCVTLAHNKVSGDWAGFARERIEGDHPGAVALVAAGCAGDQNPSSGVTGANVAIADAQGAEIAREVARLLGRPMRPIAPAVRAEFSRLLLPFEAPPSRAEFEERARREGPVAHHAREQLARLDRGERLRTELRYPVQTIVLGADDLAMVFLGGEVVVDYALRLQRELDPARAWIVAYSNDVSCYIPSERILAEGGYEGGGAMTYYDQPARLAPGLEATIVDTVLRQAGEPFRSPRPHSPAESLAAMRVRDGLRVEIAAAEPLVVDPVAIDFAADGALFVCEMRDYPDGMDGRGAAGGRVKRLVDEDGDGRFEGATVFLDGLPFPTGVMAWRAGILVCAAPDILYAEDTDGDGRADVRKVLYTGFATHNFQARVNGLEIGLDGWIHGACGLFGGEAITSFASGAPLALGGRDFRIRPETGEIDPVEGCSQQGRVRDDFGDAFGCDSGSLLFHFPLPDLFVRRNPFVAPPPPAVRVTGAARLRPIRRDLELFPLSGPAGGITAACGVGVYRDDLLGREFSGNVFTCEPANLVVHRTILEQRGATFSGKTADDERDREFLASTDHDFRPVEARTGPDGALWIVDMCRSVIEHPRWIPAERVAALDVRAGEDRGRIWRVVPEGRSARRVPRLDRQDGLGLVAALDSPNGIVRDLAMAKLESRGDRAVAPALAALATGASRPATRVQALATLDLLGALESALLLRALGDTHPGVRRNAVRLSSGRLDAEPGLAAALLRLKDDPDATVALHLAGALHEWSDPRAGDVLAALLARFGDDPHVAGAVFGSALPHRRRVVEGALAAGLFREAIPLAVADGDAEGASLVARAIAEAPARGPEAMGDLVGAMRRAGVPLAALRGAGPLFERARAVALDDDAPEEDRSKAIAVLSRPEDVATLATLLAPRAPPSVAAAALRSLARVDDGRVPEAILAAMPSLGPALRVAALDVLLERPAWTEALLADGSGAALAPLDPARRAALLAHPRPAIREKAARLFSRTPREAVLERYRRLVPDAGDLARGRAVFAAACAACHALDGAGREIGPDLASLTDRSKEGLLASILDPNRAAAPQFASALVVTTDGRIVTGIVAAETAVSVTLRALDGTDETVLRREIETFAPGGSSFMPEGLEDVVSPEEMADLLAYLASARTPRKSYPGNEPRVIEPEAESGALLLAASAASIYGPEIVFEEPHRNLGYWHTERDRAEWAVRLTAARAFTVEIDYSCADASGGNAFVIEGGREPLFGRIAATGGWDRYRTAAFGTIAIGPGESVIAMRADGPIRGALADVREIRLVPR